MFRFKCGNCDEWHESNPGAECQVPDALLLVPPPMRTARVDLTFDTAILDKKRFFIRACMVVPINGTDEHFTWGLWAEVSSQDFTSYIETSKAGTVDGPYSGSLANSLPFYEDCFGMPVSVTPQPDEMRPLLFAPEGESGLARHFRNGISEPEARTFIEAIMHAHASR